MRANGNCVAVVVIEYLEEGKACKERGAMEWVGEVGKVEGAKEGGAKQRVQQSRDAKLEVQREREGCRGIDTKQG